MGKNICIGRYRLEKRKKESNLVHLRTSPNTTLSQTQHQSTEKEKVRARMAPYIFVGLSLGAFLCKPRISLAAALALHALVLFLFSSLRVKSERAFLWLSLSICPTAKSLRTRALTCI